MIRGYEIRYSHGKQERRGGIETRQGGGEEGLSGPRKQERRGGIETPIRRMQAEVVGEKQERRGGIETGIFPWTSRAGSL